MIKKLSPKTNKNILKRIEDIHKQCVLENNSGYYNTKQIKEWLSTISYKNIKNQLDNTSWIIIEENTCILGFAQYSLEEKEIFQIQIDSKFQGKGYGKKLYKYIETDFIKNNISEISLFSTLNAVSFYKRIGFKIIKNIEFQLVTTSVQMVAMKKAI